MRDDGEFFGAVSRSVVATLAGFPDSVSLSPTAMAALELAKSIDLGPEAYRFQAALVRELRDCMADLSKAAESLGGAVDDVDDLTARRAARRSGAEAAESAGSAGLLGGRGDG